MVATDQIVKELCLEMGDPSFLNYNKLLAGVLDGIRDLSIYNMPSFSHKVLEINNYNGIDWPCGCIKPILTCLLRDGKCVILDVSDELLDTFPEDQTKVDTPTSDNQIKDAFNIEGGFFNWYGNFNWGLGEIYGLTSYRAFGYVSHDKNVRQSYIKGNCVRTSDQIVMFFIDDGLSECPLFVPSECKTAIENMALHKFFRVKDTAKSQVFLKDYKENFTRINKFQTGDDVHTWVAAMNSNEKSSPKT